MENYELVRLLGKGACGEVHLARSRLDNDYVAIKVIDLNLLELDEKKLKHVFDEIKIHGQLDHPSILKLYSVFEDNSNKKYLVLEYCPNGDLQKYLHDKGGRLTESEACLLMKQIVKGVMYLHSKKIIHRDLKLENILLTQDLRVKLADFGLAAEFSSPDDKQKTLCGTPNYMSPEIAEDRGHGLPADVWSLGCILYNLLVGHTPFKAKSVPGTLSKVKEGSYIMPGDVSPEAQNLIQSMLIKDPNKRIQLKDILDHPFMKKHNENKMGFQNFTDSGVGSQGTMSVTNSNVTTNTYQEYTSSSLQQRSNATASSLHRPFEKPHYRSAENIAYTSSSPVCQEFSSTPAQPLCQSRSLRDIRSKVPQLPSRGMTLGKCWSHPKENHAVLHFPMGGDGLVINSQESKEVKFPHDSAPAAGHHHFTSRISEHSADSCHGSLETNSPATLCSHTWHTNSMDSGNCSHCNSCLCRTNSSRGITRSPLSTNYNRGVLPCQQNSQHHQANLQALLPQYPVQDTALTKQKKVLHLPPPLNTVRLKPKAERTKNAMLRILHDGEVCIEFLRVRGQQEHVTDVCKISQNGKKITIYKAAVGTRLSTSPPPAPSESSTDVFNYENLPQCHWKKYIYAARFVDLVKAKTPKVVYHSNQATCVLMENAPNANFEASFYNGGNITLSSGSVKIIEPNGKSYLVDSTWMTDNASSEIRTMWDHFWKGHSHCCMVESALENISGAADMSLFPITMGKSRRSAAKVSPKQDNNKENESRNTPIYKKFSLSDYQAISPLSAYSGTISNSQFAPDTSSGPNVKYPRPAFRDLTSKHNQGTAQRGTQELHSNKVSSQGYTSSEKQKIGGHVLNAKVTGDHPQNKGVQKPMQGGILQRVYVKDIGLGLKLDNGDVEITFNDKIKLTFPNKSSYFHYTTQWGKVDSYERKDDHLPPYVRDKLAKAQVLIRHFSLSGIQYSASSHVR